jgi:multisubunit Na+/H+ antiporter MnhG subunit
MERELIFALISTGIYLIGAIPLWRDVIHGRTIPHIFTYIVWLILIGFNIYVLFSNGEFITLIPVGLTMLSLIFCCLYGIS